MKKNVLLLLIGHGPTQPKRMELDAAEHQGFDFGSLIKRLNWKITKIPNLENWLKKSCVLKIVWIFFFNQ